MVKVVSTTETASGCQPMLAEDSADLWTIPRLKQRCQHIFVPSTFYGSGSQTGCRDTFVCRQNSPMCRQN
jgi:hypothetical protein